MTDIDRRNVLKAMAATAAAVGVPGIAGAAMSSQNATALPKGMSRANFTRAVAELRAIVGDEWVFADPESVLPYKKIMVPDTAHVHVPSGAVAPASTEEVQRIVQVANRYKLPLWVVSTGKNLGYGAATPATTGQMVLDLKRMNRILEVDTEMCTALVEPGVTYQQLADYIAEHKLPLWLDVPAPGPICGPVGNALDRGGGYTPYGDHFMTQCGMEVVLPDGQVLRTGQGSVKNTDAWQSYKWGYGPYVDGLFSQSNLGIVTKMGLWLMPAPPVYKPFVACYDKLEDIEHAVNVTRDLQLHGVVVNGVLCLSGAYQLAFFNRRNQYWDKPEQIPDEVFLKAANDVGIGMWNTYFALYGTEESIALAEPMIRKAYEATGARVFAGKEMDENPYFHHNATLMRGGLNLDEFGIIRWRGNGGGLAWFIPVGAARGSRAVEQTRLAKKILAKYSFDYTSGWGVGGRSLHHVIALLYDKSNPEEELRAEACFRELVEEFGKRGLAPYRVGSHAMDLVAEQYGKVNLELNRRIKRAIDPNGIIAPGKSGII
ncbi:FAD-binding oxidoreductase [Pseudothauera rhizosphaerae]|uniref:FAD-binding oxidoreductase n=1 Tax=Pseudothauera rhizosphaerae TaxID=2565932 RepID=A0A4S4AMH5_9RHOO|nr:FAD-binding oxidoreductase [Pseudothauera rhizosphaerae]THF60358.1 FAD-binding oxidoreductase [Pseudothauera rhizosphaerae]